MFQPLNKDGQAVDLLNGNDRQGKTANPMVGQEGTHVEASSTAIGNSGPTTGKTDVSSTIKTGTQHSVEVNC